MRDSKKNFIHSKIHLEIETAAMHDTLLNTQSTSLQRRTIPHTRGHGPRCWAWSSSAHPTSGRRRVSCGSARALLGDPQVAAGCLLTDPQSGVSHSVGLQHPAPPPNIELNLAHGDRWGKFLQLENMVGCIKYCGSAEPPPPPPSPLGVPGKGPVARRGR